MKKFYVFEGPDHCGKTTQIEMLKKYFEEQEKIDVVFTREPGGKNLRLCENIREILLDPENSTEIDPITEAYLYAASRARHVREIKKHLQDKDVISDRYYYSSLVYQGLVRGLGIDNILHMNQLALQSLQPDIVFYLKIDFDTYQSRRTQQVCLDRLEQEDISFFSKVINGYNSDNIFGNSQLIVLDGTQPAEIIHQEILKHIR